MAVIRQKKNTHSVMHKEVNADLVAHLKKSGASLNNFDIFDPVLKGKTISEVLKALKLISDQTESSNEAGKIEKLYSKALGTDKKFSMDYSEEGQWEPFETLSRKISRKVMLMRDRTVLVCTGTDTIIVSKTRLQSSLGNSWLEKYLYLIQSTITRDPVATFVTTEHKHKDDDGNILMHINLKKLGNPRDYNIPNADLCTESKYIKHFLLQSPETPQLEYEEVEKETLEFISELIAASDDFTCQDIAKYKPILIDNKGVQASIEPPRKFKVAKEGYGKPNFSPIPRIRPAELSPARKTAKTIGNYWEKLKHQQSLSA